MTGNCTLCGDSLDEDARYCTCGNHLHDRCYDGHREWCPTAGTERWVGAVEL